MTNSLEETIELAKEDCRFYVHYDPNLTDYSLLQVLKESYPILTEKQINKMIRQVRREL